MLCLVRSTMYYSRCWHDLCRLFPRLPNMEGVRAREGGVCHIIAILRHGSLIYQGRTHSLIFIHVPKKVQVSLVHISRSSVRTTE
jgi:hypothetical protein